MKTASLAKLYLCFLLNITKKKISLVTSIDVYYLGVVCLPISRPASNTRMVTQESFNENNCGGLALLPLYVRITIKISTNKDAVC